MFKFKPGDKVVCVDDTSNAFLRKGAVYTIRGNNGEYVHLEEGRPGGYYPHRFRLIEEIVADVVVQSSS
jgi:C-terminal processing protease CtpA/Prc